MMERINRKSKLKSSPELFEQFLEDDPLSGVANLVDVMLVFAVGLMLALVTYYSLPELLLSEEEITLIKNPNQPNMEIIKKVGEKIEKYKITTKQIGGEGQRIGVVYRLKTGEIVYVPEEPESKVGEE